MSEVIPIVDSCTIEFFTYLKINTYKIPAWKLKIVNNPVYPFHSTVEQQIRINQARI